MRSARALVSFLVTAATVGASAGDPCYRLVGQADLGGEVRAVAVSGHNLLVAGERLWSVAIADPFRPTVETDTLLPWNACGLDLAEPRAFVAGLGAGLAILERGECLSPPSEATLALLGGAEE